MASLPDSGERLYVDEARTHQVWTRLERRRGGTFLTVLEAPFGSEDSRDVLYEEHAVASPLAARLARTRIEERLAATGARYFRVRPDTGGVEPLEAPSTGPVDVRAHEIPLPGEPGRTMRVQHFHKRGGASRLQVAIPRVDLPGERYALANVEIREGEAEGADVSVVHARLAPASLRHQWAGTSLDLSREGYRKLATARDYASAFGEDWETRWRNLLGRAIRGVLGGAAEEPDEVPEASSGETSAAPLPSLEEALAHPIVRGLIEAHLAPGEREKLLSGGALAIRRFVQQRRRGTAHEDQPRVSLLEAALLVESGLAHDDSALLAEEGPRLLRLLDLRKDPPRFPA